MSLPPQKRIAVIPGDGVGPEVIESAQRVVTRALDVSGRSFDWNEFPWGSNFYRKHGRMMPADALDTLSDYDALLIGAVGDPEVPDDITLWGLTLHIRQGFDQYVNYRPVRWLPGVPPRLAGKTPRDVDMVFIRENSEGEYVDLGGRGLPGPREFALQIGLFTRAGISRIVRYAFEKARQRRRRLTSVTKSNALRHSMVLWDQTVNELAGEYPDVQTQRLLIDAAAYQMVLGPESFDVVVASNLFGDILTDLAAAIQGSLGLAASANLDPTGVHPSAFEPVHGSAPDIAGKGIANPAGGIWSGALMCEHLGERKVAGRILGALARACASGPLTPDLGGSAGTEEFTQTVLREIES